MLNLYYKQTEKIALVENGEAQNRMGLVWADLLEPTLEEKQKVERLLEIEIPTREEMHEIELSSRLYDENNAIYMTFYMVTNADTDKPETHNITFIMTKEQLVTIRYVDPIPFKLFSKRVERFEHQQLDNRSFAIALLEIIIDRVADVLENVVRKTDEVSKSIFHSKISRKKGNYEDLLLKIGFYTDLVSKVRESLLSLSRLVSFMNQSPLIKLHKDEVVRLETAAKDIFSISDHASFMSNKMTFLLDAILGLINIEQNGIIKIFSVAAVVFLPPTLIASIYGMNFHFMPELDWKYGYPMAVGLMVLAAILPYQFFKKKGWL